MKRILSLDESEKACVLHFNTRSKLENSPYPTINRHINNIDSSAYLKLAALEVFTRSWNNLSMNFEFVFPEGCINSIVFPVFAKNE